MFERLFQTPSSSPKCGYALTPEKIAAIKNKQKEFQKNAGIGCLSLIGLIVLISIFSLLNESTRPNRPLPIIVHIR